jgi:hypothetical protein
MRCGSTFGTPCNVRRASNFRVICPNRMLNIRPGLFVEDAREAASLWGGDAVHPSLNANRMIATKLEDELESDARFTNPPKEVHGNQRKQRSDLSLRRQSKVDGCSASLPRGDIQPMRAQQGTLRGGGSGATRGHRGGKGKYRPYPPHWRKWSTRSSSSCSFSLPIIIDLLITPPAILHLYFFWKLWLVLFCLLFLITLDIHNVS